MDPVLLSLFLQGGGALLKGIAGGIAGGRASKESKRQFGLQQKLSKRGLNLQGMQGLSDWRNNAQLKGTRLDFYNDTIKVLSGMDTPQINPGNVNPMNKSFEV